MKRPRIKEVGIELVRGCNVECIMCPVDRSGPYRFMSLETLRLILERLKDIDYKKRFFLVGRGETLLHPKLEEIFSIFEYLYTNATVLTRAKAETICKYDVVNELVFSIDGHGDKETYEYIRRNTKWEKVVNNVLNFLDQYKKTGGHKINYRISVIVPEDYSKLPFEPIPRDRIISNFNKVFGSDMPVVLRDSHNYDGETVTVCAKDEPRRIMDNCYRFIEGDFNFTYDGYVTPCCAISTPSEKSIVGNIREETIPEIYYSERYQEMRRHLSTNRRDMVTMCENCSLKSRPEKEGSNVLDKLLSFFR
jgi:MoaA/NifB/PqqE/SkfB family radical SAM enzyme